MVEVKRKFLTREQRRQKEREAQQIKRQAVTQQQNQNIQLSQQQIQNQREIEKLRDEFVAMTLKLQSNDRISNKKNKLRDYRNVIKAYNYIIEDIKKGNIISIKDAQRYASDYTKGKRRLREDKENENIIKNLDKANITSINYETGVIKANGKEIKIGKDKVKDLNLSVLKKVNQKSKNQTIKFITNPEVFLNSQSDKYLNANSLERKNIQQNLIKDYGKDTLSKVLEVANLKRDSKKFSLQDIKKIGEKLENRTSRITVSEAPLFKLQVNTLLKEQNKSTIKGDFKPLPLTASINEYSKELKRLNKFNEDIKKKITEVKKIDLEQFKSGTFENIENKLLTKQTVTSKEKQLYLAQISKSNKELTTKQLNLGKKIVSSPVNYGKSLVIRAQTGEKNPLFNDTKSFVTGVKKGAIDPLVDLVKGTGRLSLKTVNSAFNYGKRLSSEAQKGNFVLDDDIKKIFNTIDKGAKTIDKKAVKIRDFVKKNPKESALLAGIAVGSGLIIAGNLGKKTTKDLYKIYQDNPPEFLGQVVGLTLGQGLITKTAIKGVKDVSILKQKYAKEINELKRYFKEGQFQKKLDKIFKKKINKESQEIALKQLYIESLKARGVNLKQKEWDILDIKVLKKSLTKFKGQEKISKIGFLESKLNQLKQKLNYKKLQREAKKELYIIAIEQKYNIYKILPESKNQLRKLNNRQLERLLRAKNQSVLKKIFEKIKTKLKITKIIKIPKEKRLKKKKEKKVKVIKVKLPKISSKKRKLALIIKQTKGFDLSDNLLEFLSIKDLKLLAKEDNISKLRIKINTLKNKIKKEYNLTRKQINRLFKIKKVKIAKSEIKEALGQKIRAIGLKLSNKEIQNKSIKSLNKLFQKQKEKIDLRKQAKKLNIKISPERFKKSSPKQLKDYIEKQKDIRIDNKVIELDKLIIQGKQVKVIKIPIELEKEALRKALKAHGIGLSKETIKKKSLSSLKKLLEKSKEKKPENKKLKKIKIQKSELKQAKKNKKIQTQKTKKAKKRTEKRLTKQIEDLIEKNKKEVIKIQIKRNIVRSLKKSKKAQLQIQQILLKETKVIEDKVPELEFKVKQKSQLKQKLKQVQIMKNNSIQLNLNKNLINRLKLLEIFLIKSIILLDLSKQTPKGVLIPLTKKEAISLKVPLKKFGFEVIEKTKIDTNIKQIQKPLIAIKNKTLLKSLSKPKVKQKIKQKLIQKTTKNKKIKIPKLTFESKLPKGTRLKYDIKFKERGKVKTRQLGLPLNAAIKKGFGAVDNTTQASAQLVIVGITKSKDIASKDVQRLKSKFTIRKGKDKTVLLFVEKNKNRIDTQGEKKGLKLSKVLKNKKKK